MTEPVAAADKSDGLDIVSIGKLYEGPWEKKYWSSSRGKDRHPYPVGYVSLRANNGNTYKMAILEGLKGPEFVISSTDGQSSSGQTPDIAWDGFQKKSCVRIKFWRGKRFSCKIDGAEVVVLVSSVYTFKFLFGFKNPLVSRLLRGLKANVSETTEQSLQSSSCSDVQPKVTREHHADVEPKLVKTSGKEKRSKKRREVHVKSLSGTNPKRGRPRDPIQRDDGPHCSQNEENSGLETVSCIGNNNSELLSVKDGAQFDTSITSEHLEMEKCMSAQDVSTGSKDLILIGEGTNLFENQENLDVSMSNRTLTSMKTDEQVNLPVQKDSQMLNDVDLYAPDTLDLTLDSTCIPEVEIPKESTCALYEKLHSSSIPVSENCVTDSHIKDEMIISTGSENSEKSDSDPLGHEITNSMMTLLLPRALPLLRTFSRKKKTSKNCTKKDLYGTTEHQRKETDLCQEDVPSAKYSEQIQLEKLTGEAHIQEKLFTGKDSCKKKDDAVLLPGTDTSTVAPGLEDSVTVAPDSFENGQFEVMESTQAGHVEDTVEADQDTVMNSCTDEGIHVFPNNQASEAVEGFGAAIMSSMLTVDHGAPKETIGFTVGVVDGNETRSTADVSASNTQIDKLRHGEQIDRLQLDRVPTGPNGAQHQDDIFPPNYKVVPEVCGESVNREEQCEASDSTELFEQGHQEVDGSLLDLQDQRASQHVKTKMVHSNKEAKMSSNDELENVFEHLGCYVHPTPISMVMLRTKGNEVFICVLCGSLMEKDRTLLFYKASIEGERRGCPSIIGHTTIVSPIPRYASGRQILLDSSSLQFTPDGECLVLLNEIKAPYCREGSVNCSCSPCTSDCFEKNAVKVVQVKLGYVEVVCKLKTTNNVCSILVCEPNYLVAAEDSGRVNLWAMNSPWSAPTDQSYLPSSDCMPNYIVEMKRIPSFPSLIVGHSACGDFFLWDLPRRALVSKFSAPGTSSLPFLPINIYRCPSQASFTTDACRKNKVADIMEETQRWSMKTDCHSSLPINEDLSLVLLISSVSNVDLHNDYLYKDSGVTPAGSWSLALLAKGKLVQENSLDPSATIAGASAGYGIIGTREASLYIWEMSTGTKLGYLSHCKGATLSCLAADDSNSGAFAVAIDDSQLQVYIPGTLANSNNHD
uniref:uncharacterized protein LOC122597400 n=1 Tax=Erigeron canadensis TaxID=72917 RepID=UPI001CB8EDA1|nr:uncharacterized protein LOC122597400 [Erigeron canadensis]